MALAAKAPTAATLEWVRPPKQARSQRTLERLLDAAETLIEERGVDGMTISAIVAEAGSSVGAFYARFGDKETLLRCLSERFFEQARATATVALAPERWQQASIDELIFAIALFATRVFDERRGVIAALTDRRHAAADGASSAETLSKQIADKLLTLANVRGESIAAANPHAAITTCVWLVLASLASWAQAGSPADSPPADAENFARDVAKMTCGFLFSNAD